MSDFLRPHRLLPARLLPRISLGKNTTVGSHFLLQGIFPNQGMNPDLQHCRQILYHLSHQRGPNHQCSVQFSRSVRLFATPWNSPGQNTGMGSHFLLQGIFLTQGLNPGLPHCRQILYHLSHQGSPPHNIMMLIKYSSIFTNTLNP